MSDKFTIFWQKSLIIDLDCIMFNLDLSFACYQFLIPFLKNLNIEFLSINESVQDCWSFHQKLIEILWTQFSIWGFPWKSHDCGSGCSHRAWLWKELVTFALCIAFNSWNNYQSTLFSDPHCPFCSAFPFLVSWILLWNNQSIKYQ